MDNNDLLIRLRYALDIKNNDMIKIFKLGGINVSKDEVIKILTRTSDSYYEDYDDFEDDEEDNIKCDNKMLDSFLDGFIIFKRGKQKDTLNKPKKLTLLSNNNVNNVFLKKLKIALTLTSDDVLEIFDVAGIDVSKSELTAIFRKEGHKNYKECGDKFARNFLKGLALKHR